MLTPQPHPLVVLDGHEQIRHRFAEAMRAVEDPIVIFELHIPASHVCVDGRSWLTCSCGLVMETFGGAPSCPIGDAEAMYRWTVDRAAEARDQAIARWAALSQSAARDLKHAVATERR